MAYLLERDSVQSIIIRVLNPGLILINKKRTYIECMIAASVAANLLCTRKHGNINENAKFRNHDLMLVEEFEIEIFFKFLSIYVLKILHIKIPQSENIRTATGSPTQRNI